MKTSVVQRVLKNVTDCRTLYLDEVVGDLGDVAVVDAVVSVPDLLLGLATATSDEGATAGLGTGRLGALGAAAARLGQGCLGAGRAATPATHVRAGPPLQGSLFAGRGQDPGQGHETLEDVSDVVVVLR